MKETQKEVLGRLLTQARIESQRFLVVLRQKVGPFIHLWVSIMMRQRLMPFAFVWIVAFLPPLYLVIQKPLDFFLWLPFALLGCLPALLIYVPRSKLLWWQKLFIGLGMLLGFSATWVSTSKTYGPLAAFLLLLLYLFLALYSFLRYAPEERGRPLQDRELTLQDWRSLFKEITSFVWNGLVLVFAIGLDALAWLTEALGWSTSSTSTSSPLMADQNYIVRHLNRLAPEEFAAYLNGLLNALPGWSAVEQVAHDDEGSVILRGICDSYTCVVQGKQLRGTVPALYVQSLEGLRHHDSADCALFITTGLFDEQSRAFVINKPIGLWDASDLVRILKENKLSLPRT